MRRFGSERFNLSEAKPAFEVRKLCLRFECILLTNKNFGGFQRWQQSCRKTPFGHALVIACKKVSFATETIYNQIRDTSC